MITTAVIYEQNIDILAVSETWLNENIASQLVSIRGYTFLRRDRGGRGGGVGLYIRNYLNFSIISMPKNNIEQIWVLVTLAKLKVIIGSVYNPHRRNYQEFLNEFEDPLSFCLPYSENIICLGDFNIDFLKSDDPATLLLCNIIESFDLHQIINQPTRITDTTVSLIDLIMASDLSLVDASGIVACHLADHDLIFCDIISC